MYLPTGELPSILMTLPSVSKLLLMLLASFCLLLSLSDESSAAAACDSRSDPARSTRLSTEMVVGADSVSAGLAPPFKEGGTLLLSESLSPSSSEATTEDEGPPPRLSAAPSAAGLLSM